MNNKITEYMIAVCIKIDLFFMVLHDKLDVYSAKLQERATKEENEYRENIAKLNRSKFKVIQ